MTLEHVIYSFCKKYNPGRRKNKNDNVSLNPQDLTQF